MANYCSNCGGAITADIRFCGNCGIKAAPATDSTESTATLVAFPPGAIESPAPRRASTALPAPPSLHWAIVLMLSILTLGIFAAIWGLVLAIWVKRLTGNDKPVIWWSFTSLLHLVLLFNPATGPIPGLLFAFATFSLRKHVLIHYRSVEPISLELSSAKTLFGGIFYLQARFSQIGEMKRAQPQYFAPYCTPVAYQPIALVYQPTR